QLPELSPAGFDAPRRGAGEVPVAPPPPDPAPLPIAAPATPPSRAERSRPVRFFTTAGISLATSVTVRVTEEAPSVETTVRFEIAASGSATARVISGRRPMISCARAASPYFLS